MKFEFSDQMVVTIGQIVETAPYKTAAPILLEMQKQIDAQKPDGATLSVDK